MTPDALTRARHHASSPALTTTPSPRGDGVVYVFVHGAGPRQRYRTPWDMDPYNGGAYGGRVGFGNTALLYWAGAALVACVLYAAGLARAAMRTPSQTRQASAAEPAQHAGSAADRGVER